MSFLARLRQLRVSQAEEVKQAEGIGALVLRLCGDVEGLRGDIKQLSGQIQMMRVHGILAEGIEPPNKVGDP